MIKKVCYCDRCKVTTLRPIDLALGSLNIETGDVTTWPERPDSLQLCSVCARSVLRFATTASDTPNVTKDVLPDEEQSTPEEVSPPGDGR